MHLQFRARAERPGSGAKILIQSDGGLKPVYSNSKFVCISCGKARFEKKITA